MQRKKDIAAALTQRKSQLEAEARDIQRRKQAVEEAEAEVLRHTAMLKAALDKLHKREADVNTLREAVLDQQAVEAAVAQNRYIAPSIF